MHISNVFLGLAAAGLAAASPIEERAAPSCSIGSIKDIITAVYMPSAVPFCNAYLSVPTKTVTTQITNTPSAKSTVTKTAIVTNIAKKTSIVQVTVQYSVMAAVSVGAQSSSGPTSGQTSSTSQTGAVTARDLERRAPSATPSRFRTLKPSMIASVCSCLTSVPTVTVTKANTASAGTITQTVTSTFTQTTKTTSIQTVTATPAAFYLEMAKTSGTTVDGLYGLVNGETMDFVSTTAGASKFIIDANGYLVSETNGWVANMQQGARVSTLFFDSPDTIKNLTTVPAVCSSSTGILKCNDQTATSLYYCDLYGAELVIAGASYQGAGCTNVTLTAVHA